MSIEAIKTAQTFTNIPIPNFNDTECIAIMALHISEEVHNSIEFDEIFDLLGLQSNKSNILAFYESHKDYVGSIVKSYKAQAATIEEGSFSYALKPYLLHDTDANDYSIDLEKLQLEDAKYDKIDVLKGRVIFIFSPRSVDQKSKLKVHVGDFPVRANGSQEGSAAIDKLQNIIMGSSQCTCNQTPCTCGASLGFSGTGDDEDENKENAFERWDNIMHNANDSDKIRVYKDGELLYSI